MVGPTSRGRSDPARRDRLAVSRLPTEYSSRVPDRADSCGAAAAALQVTVEILRSATSRARLASLAEAQSSSTFDDA